MESIGAALTNGAWKESAALP